MTDRAGLIYDDSPHFIDHLSPFCALLEWPLICCEPHLAELASRFYPDLHTLYVPIRQLKLPPIVVSCDNVPLLRAAFPEQPFRHLWLPHGNSDKGWNSPFFEALKEETTALVYGQKMVDFMTRKNVFPQIVRIGNFRWHYFKKHEDFYRALFDLPKGKNFLYAPTWEDSEGNGSFQTAFSDLASNLPGDCNLFVKLHPNTTAKFGPAVEMLIGKYAPQKNILFLEQNPPIYPILAQVDAYIGDMSSIGYDFLKFGKPMYFLNANRELPLHKCGISIDPKKFAFSDEAPNAPLMKELETYTFDPFFDTGLIHALCSL